MIRVAVNGRQTTLKKHPDLSNPGKAAIEINREKCQKTGVEITL